jgi:hypothetical protein
LTLPAPTLPAAAVCNGLRLFFLTPHLDLFESELDSELERKTY